MSNMQWTRDFRPSTVDALIVGNPEILGEAKLAAKKTVAMLIVGETGTGKTTLARAMANEINGNQQSTIEEPSTERGKAYIERLQQRINFYPKGKKWIVIIDEVHNLTKDAFTGLLKLIEDPPHNRVLFALCTNRLHKVPKEVIERCKLVPIEKPSMKAAATALIAILKQTDLKVSKEERSKLVRKAITDANFGMRGAVERLESMHDKIMSGTPVSKILTGKYAEAAGEDEAIGDVEVMAGNLLRAIFLSTDLTESINFIYATTSKIDPINVVERMAGILYYGYILDKGGKWNWQSKPFKAIFKDIDLKLQMVNDVLEGLTKLRENLKTAEGDQAIICAVEMARLANKTSLFYYKPKSVSDKKKLSK